jgi:hypothetical protein
MYINNLDFHILIKMLTMAKKANPLKTEIVEKRSLIQKAYSKLF